MDRSVCPPLVGMSHAPNRALCGLLTCKSELWQHKPVNIERQLGFQQYPVCSSDVLLNLAHFWGKLEARDFHPGVIAETMWGIGGVNQGVIELGSVMRWV